MLPKNLLSRSMSTRSRGLFAAGVLGLGILAGGQALASTRECGDDFYDGTRAYEAGNKDAAVQIWTHSALAGDVLAQNRLGEVYENGDHVLINYIEAHKWYNLAANNDLQVCSGDFGNKQAQLARKHSQEARARLEDVMTARAIAMRETSFVDIYECKGDSRSLYQLGASIRAAPASCNRASMPAATSRWRRRTATRRRRTPSTSSMKS